LISAEDADGSDDCTVTLRCERLRASKGAAEALGPISFEARPAAEHLRMTEEGCRGNGDVM